MKNWLKICLIIVLVIIIAALGIVGISLWNVPLAQRLFPFLEISVEFPNKVIALFTALLAGATFLLALAAFWAIRQNYSLHKKERKERLLNEIIEWAEDINNASLTPDISLISKVVELMKKERDVNELMRYGNSLAKAISIETITSEGFKKELLGNVQGVIVALAKCMCIKQYSTLHTLPSEQGFYKNVIDEIQKEINNKKPAEVEDLFTKYATELAQSVNTLLRETNKIKTEGIT